MSYEITAKLHKVFEIQSKTNTFQAREFVLETEGQYPQYVKFQLTQDRCSLIDNHKEGDQIKVSFDLRGREWNEKYFTNLNAWKIEAASDAPVETAQPPRSSSEPGFPTQEPKILAKEDEVLDDLPF